MITISRFVVPLLAYFLQDKWISTIHVRVRFIRQLALNSVSYGEQLCIQRRRLSCEHSRRIIFWLLWIVAFIPQPAESGYQFAYPATTFLFLHVDSPLQMMPARIPDGDLQRLPYAGRFAHKYQIASVETASNATLWRHARSTCI